MLKKYFANKRKKKFSKMELMVPNLSDEELKMWYNGAETQRMLGGICEYERNLLFVIENELDNRGLKYMVDY